MLHTHEYPAKLLHIKQNINTLLCNIMMGDPSRVYLEWVITYDNKTNYMLHNQPTMDSN